MRVKRIFEPPMWDGYIFMLDNGYEVSVQFGKSNYASGDELAETAIINPKGDFVKRFSNDADNVQGWQNARSIVETLAIAARLH